MLIRCSVPAGMYRFMGESFIIRRGPGKFGGGGSKFVFSSPEHEVLMVSYCDQCLSVVRLPCVVNFLL